MQSQTRKNCLYWYKFIDHTVANELLLATSFDLAQGSHQAKKTFENLASSHEILFDLVFISRPVVWSHAMLHLCFLAQPFTLANLPVFGVVLQVLM